MNDLNINNPKTGKKINPNFIGINSPTPPKIIPPTVKDPKEILYHQVKTLALWISSTSSWIIVCVPIPTVVVLNPIKINNKDIKYKLLVKPIIKLIINPAKSIGTNNLIWSPIYFLLNPIHIEASKAPNPAEAVIKDRPELSALSI